LGIDAFQLWLQETDVLRSVGCRMDSQTQFLKPSHTYGIDGNHPHVEILLKQGSASEAPSPIPSGSTAPGSTRQIAKLTFEWYFSAFDDRPIGTRPRVTNASLFYADKRRSVRAKHL